MDPEDENDVALESGTKPLVGEEQLHPVEEDSESSISVVQTCGDDCKDCELLAVKAFYCLFLGAVGFVVPFLPIFFKMKGLSAAENGLLGGLRPLVNFWSGPVWSALADKLQRRKLVLFLCVVLFSVFTFGIWFVPSDAEPGCEEEGACATKTAVTSSSSSSSSSTYPPTVAISSAPSDLDAENETSLGILPSLYTPTPVAENNTSSAEPDFGGGGHGRAFAILAVLIFFGELAGAPVLGLSDAVALETLGPKRLSQFGRQRLWGAVGYGIANLAAGYGASSLADSCGRGNYTVHFVGFAVLMVISLIVGSRLTEKYAGQELGHVDHERTSAPKIKPKVEIGRGLRLALLNARAIAFLVAVFFLAMAMAIVDNFLFWFLTELCASELLLGLSILCMCSSEVPLFIISGWAIRKFGHTACLVFVFICYAVRFLGYSLLTDAWWVLPIEPLHGVTFALMWSCSVSYAKKMAPPNLEATLQGVLNGVFWGVGRGTGAVLGGFVYKRYGARWLFRSAAIAALALGILYSLAEVVIRQYERRRPVGKQDRMPLVTEMEMADLHGCESPITGAAEDTHMNGHGPLEERMRNAGSTVRGVDSDDKVPENRDSSQTDSASL